MIEIAVLFAKFFFKIFVRDQARRDQLEKDFRDLLKGYRHGESGGLAKEDEALKERIEKERGR